MYKIIYIILAIIVECVGFLDLYAIASLFWRLYPYPITPIMIWFICVLFVVYITHKSLEAIYYSFNRIKPPTKLDCIIYHFLFPLTWPNVWEGMTVQVFGFNYQNTKNYNFILFYFGWNLICFPVRLPYLIIMNILLFIKDVWDSYFDRP